LGDALDFIDNGAIQSLNESHGISARGIERSFILERQERHVVCGHLLGESGFAGLPGTGEQHYASVRQSLF
jgi:hypothetical protein